MFWHIDADIIAFAVICALYIHSRRIRPEPAEAMRDQRFLWCLLTGIFVTVVDIAASLVMEMSVPAFIYHALMTLYFICIELLIVLWLYYVDCILFSDDEKKRKTADRLAFVPFTAYALLVCSNPWTGLIYTLENGVYARGPLFFLMVALYALYVLAILILMCARRRHIPSGYPGWVLLLIPFVEGVTTAVQLLIPGWLMILPGYMVCLVLSYLFLQSVRSKNERALLTQMIETVENFSSGLAICHISGPCAMEMQYLSDGCAVICEEDKDTLLDHYRRDILYGVHIEDRERVRAVLDEQSVDFRGHELNYRFITAAGKQKWINARTRLVPRGNDTAALYITYTDVTEQRAAEQQLTDLIHTVPCGICLYRWDGGDLHPLIVNNRFSEMLGEDALNYLEGVEQLNYTHVHPDDLEGLRQASFLALTETHEIDTTYRSLNTRLNEYLWVRMRGTMLPQPDGSQYVYVSYYDVTQEHKAVQQLRESEKTLEAAAEHAGLWYWRYDAEHGTAYFDAKNQAAFGLPPVVENYPDAWLSVGYVLPEDAPLFREATDRIKAGEDQVEFEARVRTKEQFGAPLTDRDQGAHWARFRFMNMRDATGRIITAVCTAMLIDVEKELEAKYELERKRKALDDENLLAHALIDLTAGRTLEYAYRSGDEVPEYDRTAFSYGAQNGDLLLDEQERAQFLALNDKAELLRRFAVGEAEFSLDYRRRLPDGSVCWVRSLLRLVRDPRNADVLLFAYWYNVEEEKLRELMYRSLASDVYDYAARIDCRSGHFRVFPRAGLQYHMPPLSGDDADAVTMLLYDESLPPEDRKMAIDNTLVANIRRNLETNDRFQFTFRETEPDGSVRHKRITQYYLDRQREIVIMTREDVTELIQAETAKNEMLANALAAANQASEAKSSFLSRVSHELRTPLNAIIGFMELAKDAGPREIKTYLANSDIAAKQLLSIINDVLDVSSIEAGKLKLSQAPFDFKQLVHSITNIYISQCAQKGLKFDVQMLTPVDEWLVGDKLRVNQILLNLLGNAVKFTDAGSIVLRIRQTNIQSGKVGVRFEIADTGCGMSREMQERLFKPFEQESAATAQRFGGSGLGLSIVGSLVAMMGGVVRVKSRQGEGSTFTVDLPFTKGETRPVMRPIQGIENLRVLAVDDLPIERDYISAVLGRLGVRFTCAASGDEALEALSRGEAEGDGYNICLVDWKMPDMDGIETSRRIRERYGEDVIVIVVSAYEHYQAEDSARAAGASMFVTKPLFQSSLFDLFMTLTGGRIAQGKQEQPEYHFAGRRVLLAEDNAMNRMVAEGLINRFGAACECAENGRIAVEMFEASGYGYYDAILMDIQMPVMDGYEATRLIRVSAHPAAKTVPILALTANAFKEDIARALASGMNDHVAKPIEPDMLAAALTRAFKR